MDPNSGSKREPRSDEWVEDRLSALGPRGDWQPDVSRGLARFQEQCGHGRNSRKRPVWIAAGAVAAALPLVAFPATRAFAQRCVSACVESGWVRSLFVGGPVPSSVFVRMSDRRTAPDFALPTADGERVRLSDFRGKVVLLNFWATWCAPCRIEIPWFVEFQETHGNRGFETIGVAMDEDGWDTVKPFVAERKVNYRIVAGNEDLAQQYGVSSLPATFIIDKAGRIAATHVGICGRNEYEADIAAVLNEQ